MKTLKEVLENYGQWEMEFEDRFGARLCQFLTEEEAKKIGFEISDHSPDRNIVSWTRDNILNQLEADVEFGFEKALRQRGISSSLMFEVVLRWNKILEDGLENWDENDYPMYGLPLFKATANKYGWENSIG